MKSSLLYNDLAKYYDTMYAKNGRIDYVSLVKFLNKFFKRYKCKKILDVGCGTGKATIMLHDLGYDIQGTDANNGMLSVARQKSNKIKFFRSDMRKIETHEKFDAIFISFRAFAYMVTNEDAEKAIASINRVLKNSGLLIFDNFYAKTVIMGKIKSGKMTRRDLLKARQGNVDIIRQSSSITQLDDCVTMVWTANYTIKDGKKIIKKHETSAIRAFFPSELKTILNYNGFKIIDKYGDYKMSKLKDQINLITVAKKVKNL